MDFITVPFSLILRWLSELFNNYGVALLVFALIVTAIRVPFDIKGKRGMMGGQILQPKIKEIQEKYKGNQQKIGVETQKLYKEAGVKPTAGCIWNLFPMIIMIILIGIIREPLSHIMALSVEQVDVLRAAAERLGYEVGTGAHAQTQLASIIAGDNFGYFQTAVPEIFRLNMNFLGMDMGAIPHWEFWNFTSGTQWGLFLLPILSTGGIYLTQKIMTATNYMQQAAQQAQMMKTMMLIMPLMSLFFGFTFPAAMSIYWLASNLMFTGCSVLINRRFKGVFQAMQAEMEAKDAEREKELEAKRKETARLRALNATQENKGTSKKKKQLAEREKERQRLADQRAAQDEEDDYNPSRVEHRKYARGRAYDPERFDRPEDEVLPEIDLDADDEDELLELSESQDETRDDDLDLEEYDDEDDFDDDDFEDIDEDEDQ